MGDGKEDDGVVSLHTSFSFGIEAGSRAEIVKVRNGLSQ